MVLDKNLFGRSLDNADWAFRAGDNAQAAGKTEIRPRRIGRFHPLLPVLGCLF
jgi:hypothetical protein